MDNTSLQSHLLKTLTANFDPEEDRIRLDCDLHIEKQAQIFLHKGWEDFLYLSL